MKVKENRITIQFTAGETLAEGDVVYISGANEVKKATVANSGKVVGVADEAASAGDTVNVVVHGKKKVTADGTISAGDQVTASSTAGRVEADPYLVAGGHTHRENTAASYTQNATTADAESAVPGNFYHDYFDRPVELDVSETIQAKVAEDAAGASRCTVLIWLGDEIEPAPEGRILTVRATASKTLSAYAWTNAALTFTQSLPAGRYAIVGLRAYSANLLAARLVIPGVWHRPGCVGIASAYAPDVPRFRYGAAGNWGEFEHNLPPTVDFLATAADTSQVVHLDLVQVRAGAA